MRNVACEYRICVGFTFFPSEAKTMFLLFQLLKISLTKHSLESCQFYIRGMAGVVELGPPTSSHPQNICLKPVIENRQAKRLIIPFVSLDWSRYLYAELSYSPENESSNGQVNGESLLCHISKVAANIPLLRSMDSMVKISFLSKQICN